MFSGGSQFAFIGVVAAGGVGSAIPAIVSAWLIGVRNGFYAIRLNSLLGVSGLLRILAAQLTIDESTAVSTSQSGSQNQKRGFWLTGFAVFLFWNSFTALGAVMGSAVGDPSRFGLDAAAAVAFLALVWPQLKTLQSNAVAAIAFIVAVVLSPVLSAGLPVIAAGLVGVIIGWQNWFSRKGTAK